MSVKIMADSASDLPLQFFKDNDVLLFPLQVLLDGQEYKDLITIDPKKVYDSIRSGQIPKTSQVSPVDFEKEFRELAKSGREGIYIAFSSQLSGTYQTAAMVRDQVKEEYPDLSLSIIDTKCASLGAGLIVKEAARLSAEGASMEDIEKDILFRSRHMEHLFTVEDLDHLAKGGRVSKASAFLGGLLNIKPLLHVEDGKLVPIEKIRGKKKVLRRMIEVAKERGKDFSGQTIAISHADNLETAEEVKAMLIEELGPKEVLISDIGAAIGSHTGAGTIALFFLNEIAS
ncbi:DegV family protein [Bacillus infantis]|jgi:DegV family protein with EDD domain|uniref:DegV family protein n=1 Tax=Bacillus infantis TaxID=324767 RepID=UPI001CD3D900|nr:DegV family protein [Bacillus infantis]MCA1039490.1 DegV family protein [Bacillus infantis]MCR6610035.1 DegV family protein [Bacillus infantis]